MAKHLYLHVPFCNNICAYCDFTHQIYNESLVLKWLTHLQDEILSYHIEDKLETIYIGGGTPSCLKTHELKSLLETLKPYSQELTEYTIEVNPESLDLPKVKLFKEYGVNRISMGMQSIHSNSLKLMRRKHDKNDVIKAVQLLKDNGIDNISLDAMYALPFEDINDFKKTLEFIVSLDIKHISIYALTIEEKTIFGRMNLKPISEEEDADMYEMAIQYLKDKGYQQYEVSNFCKENYYSRHNCAYWSYKDFYGISLGASGKLDNLRYTNTSSFKNYFLNEYRAEEINLSKQDMMFENVMMSLRTSFGLDLNEFKKRYNIDFFKVYEKPYLKNKAYFEIKNNHLIMLKPAILNEILVDFI